MAETEGRSLRCAEAAAFERVDEATNRVRADRLGAAEGHLPRREIELRAVGFQRAVVNESIPHVEIEELIERGLFWDRCGFLRRRNGERRKHENQYEPSHPEHYLRLYPMLEESRERIVEQSRLLHVRHVAGALDDGEL